MSDIKDLSDKHLVDEIRNRQLEHRFEAECDCSDDIDIAYKNGKNEGIDIRKSADLFKNNREGFNEYMSEFFYESLGIIV